MKEVGSRSETFHTMHDQVQIIELGAGRFEKIRGNAPGSVIEQGGELGEGDGFARKFPRGTAPLDHLLNGVRGQLGIAGRLKWNKRSLIFRCRSLSEPLLTPRRNFLLRDQARS